MTSKLTGEQPNAENLLSPALSPNAVWSDFMECFAQVMTINVEGPIKQMERIRFLSDSTDIDTLTKTAYMLGFDLSKDVLNLSQGTLLKMVPQLGEYPDINGTRGFINFFGLLLNADASIKNLWTEDYEDFQVTAQGPLLVDGGTWFKTTHIELDVAMSTLIGLELNPGETLADRVLSMFDKEAPATLVVKWLYFVVNISMKFGFSAKVSDVYAEYIAYLRAS